MSQDRYRVRYRFCAREDYVARMEAEAVEKVQLHQDLCHFHDNRQCAHYEQLEQTQAERKEAGTA